jgi:uncharacterized protein
MSKSITISLPVTDLDVSVAFYTALGFSINPNFPENFGGAFLMWSEQIHLVLLTHETWRTFTTRPIPPNTSSEVGFSLSCESRDAVDAMNQSAGEKGGTADINPVQDHVSMYGRDFTDPDGHVWGAMWVDMSAMPSPI